MVFPWLHWGNIPLSQRLSRSLCAINNVWEKLFGTTYQIFTSPSASTPNIGAFAPLIKPSNLNIQFFRYRMHFLREYSRSVWIRSVMSWKLRKILDGNVIKYLSNSKNYTNEIVSVKGMGNGIPPTTFPRGSQRRVTFNNTSILLPSLAINGNSTTRVMALVSWRVCSLTKIVRFMAF